MVRYLILLLATSAFSQDYTLELVNKGLPAETLILKRVADNVVVKDFELPLVIYNDYLYYLDNETNEVYFIYNLVTSPGVNGKLPLQYCLEKYSAVTAERLFVNCFNMTASIENRVGFEFAEGMLMVSGSSDERRPIKLSTLNETTKWWGDVQVN